MALLFFAITLFSSAFLLFLVQPIIGQKILPKLGGTPSVWNTCVVFFQMTLLVGYAYTHFTSKLPVKRQIVIHCVLLLVPFFILFMPWLMQVDNPQPFYVDDFQPPPGANPIVATLILLATIVGIPFFVVSTTAPLLQKWFASTGHPAAKDPYFLYGASNLGSMLSLLLYPVAFEPLFGLAAQSWFYTIGYMVLVLLVFGCGVMAFSAPPTVQLPGDNKELMPETVPSLAPEPPPELAPAAAQMTKAPEPVPSTAVSSSPPAPAPKKTAATGIKKGGKKGKHRDLAKMAPAAAIAPAAAAAVVAAPTPNIAKPHLGDPDEITWSRRFRWIALAAVPSSLMLGVTTYMSTDISAIPLFWVMPLALYLLSFILVFMRWPINWLEDAHDYVLYAQAPLLALLVLFMSVSGIAGVVYIILVMLLAFMATCLACHGEMAKDRPSAKHLTEFYLLMSVGGAVGGFFNGILAPVIFPWGVVEFGLALTVAGLLRPALMDMGWIEWLMGRFAAAGETGHRHAKGGKRFAKPSADQAGLTLILDFGMPVVVAVLLVIMLWGVIDPRRSDLSGAMFICVIVPLALTGSFFFRPLRFGLSLGAVLLLTSLYLHGSGSVVFQTRSYFGVLRVQESVERYGSGRSAVYIPYRNLMHGTTHHGLCLQPMEGAPDFSRLATTYYHKLGPAGLCMERFNWFDKWDEDHNNSFTSDARMQLSLMMAGAPNLGISMPMDVLTDLWSEPPYAVIGMGTATMSSYARPYQTCHFYEIDNQIRLLSLPEQGEPYFGYVKAALKRKANIKILMGDARLRMALPWVPKNQKDETDPLKIDFKDRGGPEYFYHLMVVDAFSSDAIPRHLITKEAIEMYFRHLVQGRWGDWVKLDPKDKSKDVNGNILDTRFRVWQENPQGDAKRPWLPGGMLCVHTSNRHLRLVPAVTDSAHVAEWEDRYDADGKPAPAVIRKGLVADRGHDSAPGHSDVAKEKGMSEKDDIGHFTSEWVIVVRDEKDLKHLTEPPKYREWCKKIYSDNDVRRNDPYWVWQQPTGNYVWTDDHTILMAVFRWPWSTSRD